MQFNMSFILEIAGAITALGGCFLTIWRILLKFKMKRERQRQSILQEAKVEIDRARAELESKIKELELELESQKIAVNKDLQHLKESYTNEIKNLGERLEILRQDINNQHQTLVNLLSRLVDNRQ